MDARRLLWVVVAVAGATMVAMLILERTVKPPEQTGPGARTGARPSASRPAATAPGAGSQPAATVPAGPARQAVRWEWQTHPPRTVTLGSDDPSQGYAVKVALTSLGAAIKSLRLAGGPELLRPVTFAGGNYYPLATRHVLLPEERRGQNLAILHWSASGVRTDPDGTQRVTFAVGVKRNGQDYLRLEKTYALAKGSNFVELTLRAVNLSAGRVAVKLTQYAVTGLPAPVSGPDRRELLYGQLAGGDFVLRRLPVAEAQDMALGLRHCRWLGRSDGPEPVLWLGLGDKEHAALVYVAGKAGAGSPAAAYARARFFRAAIRESAQRRTFLTGMNLGPHRIGPGGALTVRMKLYAGPARPDPFEADPTYKARKASGGAVWRAQAGPRREVLLGSLDQRSGYKFQVQLTTLGAAIRTLKLSEHFVTVADKRAYHRSPDTYRQAVEKAHRQRRLRELRRKYPELQGLLEKYPQLRAMGAKLAEPATEAKLPEEFRKLLQARPGLRPAKTGQ